jgi:hypothetical protein
MKLNQWTIALAAAGIVSVPSLLRADEEQKPSSVMTALSATTISGYVDTSAQWNMGTGNLGVPTYSFGGSQKADGFNLNAVKLSIQKDAEASEAWGAGYKADLMFGPDANTLGSQTGGAQTAFPGRDIAVRQAYVDLHAPIGNGLEMKIGVFDTILGYEVTDAPSDPNFTRSYGYTIEPVENTGILFTYNLSESVALNGGIANTFGPNINARAFNTGAGAPLSGPKAESFKTYLGSVNLTAPKNWGFLAGSTLTGGITSGYNAFSGTAGLGTGAVQTSWYVGGTINTPLSSLKIGAAYDYAGVNQQVLSGSTFANATTIYVLWQATEKMSLNWRGEYASSNTGVFAASKVFASTVTVQYDLWKNVLSRVEFRWDHAADASGPYGGTTVAGGKDNSYILIANIAYKF